MRYLGIDYGSKKVGLAISDEAGTMGFPRAIVPNDNRLMATIRTLVANEGIGTVVIGDSRDFSGEGNPIASSAKNFGTQFQKETGVPVVYEVEMFTTQEARRGIDGTHPQHVSNTSRTRGGKNDELVDASAAALILTSYLSRHHD